MIVRMDPNRLVAAWDDWQDNWIESGTGSDFIMIDGHVVFHQLRLSIENVKKIKLRIVRSIENPSQALAISMSPGSFIFNGERVKQGNFFADEGPNEAVIELRPKKDQAHCWVWNLWEKDGRMHSLTGAHGVLVSEFTDHIQLNCTDPIGVVDFQDLVAQIMVEDQSGTWACPRVLGKEG